MNYGKKGVKNKQHDITSKTKKAKNMLIVTILKTMLIGVLSLGIVGISLGIGMFNGIISSAPDMNTEMVKPNGFAGLVYDKEGTEIAKLVTSDANRRRVNSDKIPEDLAHAFVAIEDERFYDHNGIDIKGILRAGFIGITSGNFSEGASTITQQLIKNNVFTDWVHESEFGEKVKRKIQEQYCAIELTTIMSKKEVLTEYMNTINLGQNTLGVESAALRYFNKSAYQLTLSECAVIAGITQNPTNFNPITNPEKNAERRKKVLDNMLEQGYISQAEFDEALADDVYSRIQIVNAEIGTATANSFFVDAVIEEVTDDLINELGYSATQAFTAIYYDGNKIYSTQDSKIQDIVDDVYTNEENYPEDVTWELNYQLSVQKANGDLVHHSSEMYKKHYKVDDAYYDSKDEAQEAIDAYKEVFILPGDEELAETISLIPQPQISFTIADQSNGQVLAMMGGRGPKEASLTLNRATNTTRSPGSTAKVISSFGPAIDSAGLTLGSVFLDIPFHYETGTQVRNHWGQKYKGPLSIREAIVKSGNVVAVKVLTQITPQLGYDYMLNLGFTTLEARKEVGDQIFYEVLQPLALGGLTNGVTNLELNASYAAIANKGAYIKPSLYTKVVDQEGNVIIDKTQPESSQVFKESTAFLLTDAMKDVVTRGTGGGTSIPNMSVAGKTGTSTDDWDSWWVGYTPYYTASSWVGYDNNKDMTTTEKRLSKSLWSKVMTKVHEDLPSKTFDTPSGILTSPICNQSGKLPIVGLCEPTTYVEYFADGTNPIDNCDFHSAALLCSYEGILANERCEVKIPGILGVSPPEHPSLLTGPNAVATPPLPEGALTPTCSHTPEFFLTPGYEAVLEQQRLAFELLHADAIAAAAAAAAAAEAAATAAATTPTP